MALNVICWYAMPLLAAAENGLHNGALPEPTAGGYRLVWADEFDHDGPPDPTSWSPETGFVRNNELQWYQLDNARCTDGMLVIESRREVVPNPGYRPDGDWRFQRKQADFTSSSLTTKGRHHWRYGRFLVRARIPVGAGLWPAIWTLGSAREWPSCGEVDLMEAYKGTLKANVVWGTAERWVGRWDSASIPIHELGAGWASGFHVWRMDWDESRIVLSVDGRRLKETALSRTINPDAEKSNPFHEPHYLLLNLAIGGKAGGDPEGTEFPQRMEIDWARVYQRP